MGRHIASKSFVDALSCHGKKKLQLLRPGVNSQILREGQPIWEGLFTGDPNLFPYASERHWNDPRNFSLIGITHTLSTPAALRCLMRLPQAQLHTWDALICTSRAARSALEAIWQHSGELLQIRGFPTPSRPQLPVIPLGIHTDEFRPVCSRKEARQRLQLPTDAAVVLWTGRLEMHCKAHHGATFRALAHAAAAHPQRPWVLLMYGTAVMPTIPPALLEAAAAICPNVEVRLLNGHDISLGALARAASDSFLSLVDCLQETFGLTPIEAMASRLPVVVSDWNGYRDTVVDGRTGFRVSTQSFEPGWDDLKIQQLAYEDTSLDPVSTRISGQISVDAAAAGSALARLAKSPEMAVAMGCLGEQRAKMHYDWSVVLHRYSELMDDLQKRRQDAKADPALAPLASHHPIPPLTQIFAAWPSRKINFHTPIKPCGEITELQKHLQLAMVQIYRKELPPPELIQKVFKQLQSLGTASLNRLLNLPEHCWAVKEAERLPETMGWLLKHGFAKVTSS
ncbi:glycosyltransferase family 4 protein [Synechococcus sp. UW86]|uniref:glycosyltransferase n=1 Tax=Synechococcus sp. UW86 TaxID=368491 RepID=UPI000E0F4BAF